MKDAIIQRIRELIAAKSKSENQFATAIGTHQGTLNGYMLGKRKLSLDIILGILNAFEDVSAEWLLRGKGSMTGTDNSEAEKPIMSNAQLLALVESLNIMSSKYTNLYEEHQKLLQELNDLKSGKKAV